MLNNVSLEVPRKPDHYISKGHAFRVSFSAPLSKKPPRLSKKGYIRALELYGREDILFDSLKGGAGYFNDWRKNNPGDLDLYRRYANSLGYDWERGSVTADGIYTFHVRAIAVGEPLLVPPFRSMVRVIWTRLAAPSAWL